MLETGESLASEMLAGQDAVRTCPAAIDHAYLRRYTIGDQQLETEVLDLFAGELPKTLRSLQRSQTEYEWKAAAHTLKGSARAVGAWRIASAAVAAEKVPDAVCDPIAKAEAVAACELAIREAIAYIKGITVVS